MELIRKVDGIDSEFSEDWVVCSVVEKVAIGEMSIEGLEGVVCTGRHLL